ncbi:unnamed protein product, partial [Iphiclides podalirius]
MWRDGGMSACGACVVCCSTAELSAPRRRDRELSASAVRGLSGRTEWRECVQARASTENAMDASLWSDFGWGVARGRRAVSRGIPERESK